MRESFIFYKSFYESIKELDKDNQFAIYNAIMKYEFDNTELELDGIPKAIFTLIKPQLQANDKRYENGKKGGRPKNQTITKEKPNNNQKETKIKPNYNENVNVNENNNVNKKEITKEKIFENEDVNNLFLEFLQLRKKLKAVNSDKAIKLLKNKLSKYDDETKKQMLNESIVNSWKSVYEIKKKKETSEEYIQRRMREEEEKEKNKIF